MVLRRIQCIVLPIEQTQQYSVGELIRTNLDLRRVPCHQGDWQVTNVGAVYEWSCLWFRYPS
jgi:hypothetical protein